METLQYKLIQVLFGVLSLVLLYIIYRGLKIGLERAGYTEERKKKILMYYSSGVILWIIFISVLSIQKVFLDFALTPPRIFISVIIPAAVILFFVFTKKINKILLSIPEQWLIYIQSFRIIVEILLWMLLLLNLMPVQMSFEGRNFDILVGITAPFVAYLCFGKGKPKYIMVLIWNFAGMLLLINIVTTAILSMPTQFRYFMNEPSNTIVAYFPVIFLPAILVPIAYSMHLFSIKQILLKRRK